MRDELVHAVIHLTAAVQNVLVEIPLDSESGEDVVIDQRRPGVVDYTLLLTESMTGGVHLLSHRQGLVLKCHLAIIIL